MTLNRRHFLSMLPLAAAPGALASGGGGAQLKPTAAAFPALRQEVGGRQVAYLDSAAPTLRPQTVIDALADF